MQLHFSLGTARFLYSVSHICAWRFFAANATATQKPQCKYLYCGFVFFDQSERPAAGLRSLGDEIPVNARLLDQFLMGAPLDDAALVHHQNMIRTPHGLLPRQGFHSLLELVLVLGVHIGRGLVEDDDGCVL